MRGDFAKDRLQREGFPAPREGHLSDPQAAVAIVCTRGQNESILLLRRSRRENDSWSAQWSFPGGRCEKQDADLLHTALRELEEECGISLAREEMEQRLPPVIAGRAKPPFLPVAPFVFRIDHELPTSLNAQEAAEAQWVPRAFLLDPVQHSLRSVPGQAVERMFPAVALSETPLWGFTYRVLTDWLGLVPAGEVRRKFVFDTACRVLDWLLTTGGLRLKRGWSDDSASQLAMPEHHIALVARVEGVIPVELVRRHFAGTGADVARLLFWEVRPHRICLTGLDFEQYLILT